MKKITWGLFFCLFFMDMCNFLFFFFTFDILSCSFKRLLSLGSIRFLSNQQFSGKVVSAFALQYDVDGFKPRSHDRP